jgi:hypothetical protein
MVNCGEAVRGVAEAAREIRVLVSSTSSFIKRGVVFRVGDVEFGWCDADYGTWYPWEYVSANNVHLHT